MLASVVCLALVLQMWKLVTLTGHTFCLRWACQLAEPLIRLVLDLLMVAEPNWKLLQMCHVWHSMVVVERLSRGH